MKKFLFLFFLFICDVVHASHLDLVPIPGVYSNQYNLSNGSYFSSNQKKYLMDGRIVYCVEPGAPIYTNDYYGSDIFLSGMSSDILDKIRLIGYFGYDYPGHNTDRYFMAAQELIWETVGHNEVYFTSGINNLGDKINVEFEKNEIMSLVNRYYYKPSFDGIFVSGIYGEQIVLEDSNNVLSNFDVSSENAYIDGNKLIIDLNKVGNDQVILNRKVYDSSSSVFYKDNVSQDFMFLRASSFDSIVNVESYIPQNIVSVNKRGLVLSDYNGDFIYEEDGLDGVKFGLYASSDIYDDGRLLYKENDLVDELSTVDGVASSKFIPNGSYYLKELSTIPGFILDSNVHNINLNNDSKEVFNYMLSLTNERQKIFLNLSKHGELFEGIISDNGNYIDIPLAGVRFGLFSGGDIYCNDKLLVSKDSLIDEFITDNDGNINEELSIPFGTYYIKELDTLEGYRLDENIYEFNISKSDEEIIEIMISKEPIVNEVIKGRLIINKIDEFGNGLEGAIFRIFDKYDNLIYEGVTDSNGVISIDNLGYGKYYFYEVSAPDGFLVSDKIYDVYVNKNNDMIQVSVLNKRLPVTSDINSSPRKFSMVGLGFGVLTLSICAIYEKYKKN